MSAKCGLVCAVYNCNNYSNQKVSKSFFRFPRDENTCAQWVLKAKRSDLDKLFKRHGASYINKTYRICSDHFQESDYRNVNLKSQGLKKSVVPSQNLDKCSNRQTIIRRPPTNSFFDSKEILEPLCKKLETEIPIDIENNAIFIVAHQNSARLNDVVSEPVVSEHEIFLRIKLRNAQKLLSKYRSKITQLRKTNRRYKKQLADYNKYKKVEQDP